MKKVTIHDVAKEAGVSAATVSYIINNRTDQVISEETKQKVWHVINMLNYKPSIFAKNLRSAPESKLIAICSDFNNELTKAEFFYIFEGLEAVIDENYSLVFTANPYKRFTNADCIIAINLAKESFYQIGTVNYIPLIALNSYINDKLFFQVNIDYASLKTQADKHFDADYLFVTIEPKDNQIKEKILSIFQNVLFVNNYCDLNLLNTTAILTTETCILQYLKQQQCTVYMPEQLQEKKFTIVSRCINQALSHDKFDIHEYEV